MIAFAMTAMTFTSCEDVPAPYDYPGTGGNEGGGELAEGVYLDETFTKEIENFEVITQKGTPWSVYNNKYVIGSGYDSNTGVTTESESYLVSKEIDLSESTNAHLTFEYIFRYDRGGCTNKVYITDNYSGDPTTTNWTDITGTLTEGSDWNTWYSFDENIPADFIGKKTVRIALYYACGTSSTTWELKNLKLQEGEAENTGGGEDTPNPPAEGEHINETFATSFGSFTEKTVKGTPWIIDYSCAKATGYDNSSKTTTPSESYLVSKAIDLSASKGAVVNFEYILRYYTNYGAEKPGVADKVLITDNYTGDVTTTKWTDITGTLTEGSDWNTWYKYSVNIPAEMLGKKAVIVALYYACEDNSATWEVKNFVVKDGEASNEGGNEGGGNEGGEEVPVGDGMTIAHLPGITTNSYGTQNVSDESTWFSWTYDNISYKGAKVCAANGDFSGCIQIQGNASDAAKQGFLFNETAFSKEIKSIVLVVKGLAKYETPTVFSVYGGTEAHPVSTAIEATTETVKGETLNTFTMTYDFSAGNYKHFTIWNNAVGALYIEKVVVNLK